MKAQNPVLETDVAQETYTSKGRNLHKGASLAELTSACSADDVGQVGYVACLDWPSRTGDMEDGGCHMMGMASCVEVSRFVVDFCQSCIQGRLCCCQGTVLLWCHSANSLPARCRHPRLDHKHAWGSI